MPKADGFTTSVFFSTPNLSLIKVSFCGELVTFFADIEPARNFIDFCVKRGIFSRSDWGRLTTARERIDYINKSRGGGDLACEPFCECPSVVGA